MTLARGAQGRTRFGGFSLVRLAWAACASWWIAALVFRVWLYLAHPEARAGIFVDARLYRLASLAWLEGRDPWGPLGLHPYAAPPPTLLFTAPLALVPEALAIPVFQVAMAVSIAWVIRRLGLPWVLLIWPPLVDAWIVGNPNAMLAALLVSPLAPLAVFAKVYAVFPLAWERRWRAVGVTAIALLVTAPLLPWSTFIADRDMIARNLAEQAGNLSAWGTPLLLLVIPALLFIGRAGGWLAVPAAWPATQLGYAAIALPAARIPLVALGLSIPVPLVPAVTVLALAGWTLAHRPPADGRPTLEPGLAAQEEAR